MKATIFNDRVTIEVDASDQKSLFEAISHAEEVFLEQKCGLCGCDRLRFVTRIIDDFKFYERQCTACFARLTMGQSKERPGTLFPKRKLITSGPEAGKPDMKNGEYGPHNGWTKWAGKAADEEPPSQAGQALRKGEPQSEGGMTRAKSAAGPPETAETLQEAMARQQSNGGKPLDATVADQILRLAECKTIEQLRLAWEDITRTCSPEQVKSLAVMKDRRKEQIARGGR